jgi:hypothetical protein
LTIWIGGFQKIIRLSGKKTPLEAKKTPRQDDINKFARRRRNIIFFTFSLPALPFPSSHFLAFQPLKYPTF